jgi:hypothetical protein
MTTAVEPDATPTEPSFEDLAALVERYELASELTPAEFEEYAQTETRLEGIMTVQASRCTAELDFDGSIALLTQVIALNQQLATIAGREMARIDAASGPATVQRPDDMWPETATGSVDVNQPPDSVAAERQTAMANLGAWQDLASGLILVLQGQISSTHADERILAGDFSGAEQGLREAMNYFEQLADSELPQQQVGLLRGMVTQARVEMVAGLREGASGNFRGAYDFLDRSLIMFEEILEQTLEGHQNDDGSSSNQYEDLQRELTTVLTYTRALQGQVDLLREAQSGNYAAAIESGRETVRVFETLENAAATAGLTRNMVLLRRMERAAVNGWICWAQAELAVDERRWSECRTHLRQARSHWNEATRLSTRNMLLGLVGGRPDQGNIEMLLQATIRRCERETRLHNEIESLHAVISHMKQMNIYNQGSATTMIGRDHFQFNDAVNAAAIGSESTVEVASVNQRVDTDYRGLATELADLHSAMADGARTPAEHAAVEQVRRAAEGARRNDGHAVAAGLAAAGTWALAIAQQLSLAVATAMIQRSLGL